tara:strand:+ start:3685 stop:4173 length:489 start_codon:yes stop_codon:yes gene_type:complete
MSQDLAISKAAEMCVSMENACQSVDALNGRRESIAGLVAKMKELTQVECPVKHRFSGGLYLREILMPAGSIVIGKIHATEHFNIIISGECIVATTEGVKHIKAPYTFVSEPGIQKCVINLTDVIWQTTHVTDKTDVAEIEKDVIAEDYDKLQVDYIMKKLAG